MSGKPKVIGIGLRCKHYMDILQTQPKIDWLEIHSENYFFQGSNPCHKLLQIAEDYPISLHGVALSLGSSEGISTDHLSRVKKLINFINPFLVSEHLSWSNVNNTYLPDLLPVAYTDDSADIFIQNITQAQEVLQKQLLIENPSSYFEYQDSYLNEAEFLVHIVKSSGAKILLDVNNIFVSCFNHGWDSYEYIDKIPYDLVGEIHLAGHSFRNIDPGCTDTVIRVDTHNDFVCDEVWQLYQYALNKFGVLPTLLEWDQDIPELEVLVAEANKARVYIDKHTNEQRVVGI